MTGRERDGADQLLDSPTAGQAGAARADQLGRRGVVRLVSWVLFLSGAAALIDEVLWARTLGFILGGSHQVDALVLGVFFLAIPVGAALASRWVAPGVTTARLWRWYALCEGATALSVVVPVSISRGALQGFGARVEDWGAYFTLAALVVPGVAVGACWPLMVAIVRAHGGELGKLYSVNTLGSVVGALAASFFLVEHLGTSGGLFASGLVSGGLALSAFLVSKKGPPAVSPSPRSLGRGDSHGATTRAVWIAGTLAGVFTLSFEVIGVRLLSLEIPTTVYTLGLVLAVQLGGMAAGARLLPWFLPRGSLASAFGVAVLATAWAPYSTTLLVPPQAEAGWADELRSSWLLAATVMGPGAVALGLLFPLASALVCDGRPGDYARLGRLAALNGIGGLVGAVGTGVFLIPTIGLRYTCVLLVVAVGASGLLFGPGVKRARSTLLARLAIVAMGSFAALQLSVTTLAAGERLVAQVEGPVGVAAVIEDSHGRRRLTVNGAYTLGDSHSASVARRFALLPALLRPDPQRVLFVGLGTGISKGAAQEVVGASGGTLEVAELMPEVAELAPLFSRWQARFGPAGILHVADGRRVLRDSTSYFDLVIFDVFLPWRPGTAFLYTEETFSLVRERLTDDGLFAVWLPIYQLSPESFATVVQTFVAVFPEARLFAGGLDPSRQVIGLMSSGRRPPNNADSVASLQRAGVKLYPLLAHPEGTLALDLGEASAVLHAMKAMKLVERSEVQHGDRPSVEFDGARARGSQRLMGAEGYQRLLRASETARATPAEGLARSLRDAWRGPVQARTRLMRQLSVSARREPN